MKTLKTIFLLCLSIFFVHSELMAQFPVDFIDDFVTVQENTSTDIESIFDNDLINDSAYLDSATYNVVQPANGSVSFCPPGFVCIIGTTYMPNTNYVGLDTFYYVIEVMSNGSVWYTDSAMVLVNVVANPCSGLTMSLSETPATVNPNGNCNNDGIITVQNFTGIPPLTYSIDNGISYQASNVFSGLSSGSYTILGRDSSFCLVTDSIQVACDTAVSSCTASFTHSQTNNTVEFVGSTTWIGATPINYDWDFGDGAIGNGDTVTHNYQSAGLYTVCLITGIDCPDTVCYQVVVQDTICNDASLINLGTACPTVVTPVCGCDGQTYNNACEAIYFNGIVSFTPGPCNDSIWPGDTDYDGVVNNNDILSIGLEYGEMGPVRPGASINWIGQFGPGWSSALNNVNNKHVDTNGDGVIDSTDANAINLNYGLTHAKGEGKSGTGPELIPNFMGQTILNAGSTVNASIDYGTVDTPLVSVYGLAYTIEFDTSIIDASTIALDFTNSWFNSNGNDLNFYKVLVGQGKIDIAQTGTDHLTKSGFGSINQLTFVIQEDLAGKTEGTVELLLKITNVKALDVNGNVINTKSGEAAVDVEVGTGIKDLLGNAWNLYPNPTDNFIKINATNEVDIYNVNLISLLGTKTSLSFTNNQVDVSSIAPGVYFIEIETNIGRSLKKVVIQ